MAIRRRTKHRLIAVVLSLLIIVLAIVAFSRPNNDQTPAAALQSSYHRLGLGHPVSLTKTDQQIQALYTGLDSFTMIYQEVTGQGWKLTSTTFDESGNPVYTYTKTLGTSKLQLVLSQDVNSINDRRTSVVMSIAP
jgi:hypothetical protein